MRLGESGRSLESYRKEELALSFSFFEIQPPQGTASEHILSYPGKTGKLSSQMRSGDQPTSSAQECSVRASKIVHYFSVRDEVGYPETGLNSVISSSSLTLISVLLFTLLLSVCTFPSSQVNLIYLFCLCCKGLSCHIFFIILLPATIGLKQSICVRPTFSPADTGVSFYAR